MRYGKAAVVGLVLLVVVAGALEHQVTIRSTARSMQGEYGQSRSEPKILSADYEGRVRVYEEIGEFVHHNQRAVFFAPEYGYPLIYHGRVDGVFWPAPSAGEWWRYEDHYGPAPSERVYFENLYSEFSPRYFIVIKHFRAGRPEVESWNEDELLRSLGKEFHVIALDRDYIVFDLRTRVGSR